MGTNNRQGFMAVVYVGMMAAMIFVATYFLKFEIQTPTGPVMIKTANILCLLSGLLFGGVYGGLAAGIGSMMFDLMDPKYMAVAPFTLVFFFLMGFVCGEIAHRGGGNGQNPARNAIGVTAGALTYFVLNAGRNVLTMTLAGSTLQAAIIANGLKMGVSAVNLVVGVAGSLMVLRMVHKPLKAAGVLDKFKKI